MSTNKLNSDTQDANEPKRRRGIYLLPNLFTTCGLFAGFYAIIAAMKGAHSSAALAIFIAMVADSLDGRVARLTNTESDFGVQYDSLSDLVGFGVAPAVLVYGWALSQLGKLGWLAAFVYAAAGALRLARFNTQTELLDKRYFYGLPIPAAAGVIAGLVWFLGQELSIIGHDISLLMAALTMIVACLMISNIAYDSFKQIDFKEKVSFLSIIAVVFLFVLISINPPAVLCLAFCSYALSGPLIRLKGRRQALKS